MIQNHIPQAQGALLGALIGDAVGAVLEFLGRPPAQDEITDALNLPGGGMLRVAPGQITDDGELTLALARALVAKDTYPAESVASNYLRWIQSMPFDVGNATSMAMRCKQNHPLPLHKQMASNAQTHNHASKANGALMRCSPLGLWSTRLNQEQTAEAAVADASLTHPNPSCLAANAAYACAIRRLILSTGDAQSAFDAAQCALNSPCVPESGQAEVRDWLEDAAAGYLPACHPMAGFVRIAFTYAFHHLLEQTPYEQALRQTLTGGGDTDTNACIVGGLVGALHGVDAIPQALIQGVLQSDGRLGRERPAWLHPRDALQLAADLCA